MTALWWNCRRIIAGLVHDQQGNQSYCTVAYPRQKSPGRVMVALVDVVGSKKESKRRGLELIDDYAESNFPLYVVGAM